MCNKTKKHKELRSRYFAVKYSNNHIQKKFLDMHNQFADEYNINMKLNYK